MSATAKKTLAIIGQGYVGLPLAMAAVHAGWDVIGVDSFESKVAQINEGLSPIEDVSNTQLESAISSGAYRATTDFSEVSRASVITICVPTPLNEFREPDLALLRSAANSIGPFVSNETLVVSESTSYPGTLRNVIIPIINSAKPEETYVIHFASAPERVNPGDPIWNQKNTPRLLGAIDEDSKQRALVFYQSICNKIISVSTPEIAEAAKLLENTFRLVNIALVNEFTQLCSNNRINVHEVIDAAASKPYGFMPFRPGVGVGGHCIPVDPLYLTWWGRESGSRAHFVESADAVNQAMPAFVANRALSMIDSTILNPRVLILGVAYKPGVADIRETPVLELRKCLEAQGAIVAWHDPLVPSWEGSLSVDLDWKCDAVILAIRQPNIDVDGLLATGVTILDCTNSLHAQDGVKFL